MAMLVGFHVEGHDHLILRAFLAKLLNLTEDDFHPDVIDASGRGWRFVLTTLPKSLKRFYGRCAQFAMVGTDNDGNQDLGVTGRLEDPDRPRHWNHLNEDLQNCRYCQLARIVAKTRTQLNWLPQKRGNEWPVMIVVPVEMIESWLLAARAIVHPGTGLRAAERGNRATQKQAFYGKPEPTKGDVEATALPLIRAMQPNHLEDLQQCSRSFGQLADQVKVHRSRILGRRDCWQPGDRAAEA